MPGQPFVPTLSQMKDSNQLLFIIRKLVLDLNAAQAQIIELNAQLSRTASSITDTINERASVLDGAKSAGAALVRLGLGQAQPGGTSGPVSLGPDGVINFNQTVAIDNNARVGVQATGVPVGLRHNINIIDGLGITVTVTDDALNDRVNVSFSVP